MTSNRSPTCGGVAFRACRKCDTHALAAHDSQYPAMLTEALNGTWTKTTPCFNVTDCGQSHSNQTSQYVPNPHIFPAQSSSRSQPCARCCRTCYRCCLERPPPNTLITKPQTPEPPPAQTPLPLAPALTASPHTFHSASQQVASQPPEKPSRTPPRAVSTVPPYSLSSHSRHGLADPSHPSLPPKRRPLTHSTLPPCR